MRAIRAPSLGRAHELAVKAVLETGSVLVTEDGEATIECGELMIRVDHPETEPMVSPCSRFQRRFLEQYAAHLISGSDSVFEYDYHRRLCAWGEGLLDNKGREVRVDQLAYILRKLRGAPASRRALAITWNPAVDEELKDCPCLQLVQCLLRNGMLHMKVVFRSNDMLSAAGANMYALARLQGQIASELGVPTGAYTHISLVPHIYYIRDLHDIEPFCRRGEAIQPVQEVCTACGRCRRGERNR